MFFSIDEIEKSDIESPILNEYVAFKEQNPDSIVLIQIGTFFETYFEDAKILSELSGIQLSSRHMKGIGTVVQSGVPQNSVEFYIKLLVSNNYKVCVCPQYTVNGQNFYRKISRKYTKGTIIENEFLDSFENNYILVLYKNDDDTYLLSYADVSTGQFYKTCSSDYNEIKIEIDKICPSEILVSNSQINLFGELRLKYNSTVLQDKFFNSFNIENTILEYCKVTQKDFLVKLDKIVEYKLNQYLSMDEITRFNLELTRTKRLLKKKGSLFWFLNYTKTPMGARLLKKFIDEPLLVVELIKERQKAVCELIDKEDNFNKLDKTLSELCDLSRIGARISNITILPKDLYSLACSLENVKALKEVISGYSSPVLKINNKNFLSILNISNEIKEAVKPDAPNELKSGNIIKEGYDSNLDLLRSLLVELEDEIVKYEKAERLRLKIEKLKIGYLRNIGYYIEIPNSKKSLADSSYFRVNSTGTVVRYTTEKLKELESKKGDLRFKINQIEYNLFCKLRRKVSMFVDILRELAKDIARIDVFMSLAKCAKINNLCCPNFNNNGIYIKQGFHPSLSKLGNDLIKNDTELENNNMFIITGANMSGKSTFLRHNAIICLLSQIGSFVPAESADVTITDKIFLRQGSNDDIVNNNSSFMVEMNDLKYIIDNATEKSLILLDEPAKSTNALEGGSIARAYLEYIIANLKTKSIVVTHNFELTKISTTYPQFAQNWQIGFENECMNRKLRRGVASSSYAINTAKLANFPDEIIQKALFYISRNMS